MHTARNSWSAVLAAMMTALAVMEASDAAAQTEQQRAWCYDPNATDPQTIEGCTALANSGRFSGRDLAIILYDRGLSYENTNQYNLAMADFSQAIGLDPNYADAYDDRGNIYVHLNNYTRAIPDYDRAIAMKPDFALAYSNRGYTYYKMGNIQQALADLDRAISLDQKTGRTFVNRALARAADHNCAGAAQDYMAAKQLNWKFTISDQVKTQCGATVTQVLGP